MKKSIRKIILLIACVLLFALCLAACDNSNNTDKKLTGVRVDGSGVEIYAGMTEEAKVNVYLDYDDGSSEKVVLTDKDVPAEYAPVLSIPGEHTIEMLYRGFEVSYTVKVKERYCKITFLNLNDEVVKNIDYDMATNTAITPPTADEMKVEGYRFAGFDKDFSKINSDTRVKGVYVKTFTVEFYNKDNVLVSSQTLDQGSAAAEPTEAEKAVAGFIWESWSSSFDNVQSDLKIYGVYSKKEPETTYSQGLAFTSNGDGTCYVSGIGVCKDTDIKIPPVSPAGDTVTNIGEWAFADCRDISSVNIPGCVVSIGFNAFRECTGLTSVIMQEGVSIIGKHAFRDCDLTYLCIPNSITCIEEWAFDSNKLQYNVYDNALYLGNDTNPYVVLAKAKDIAIKSCEINDKTKFIYNCAFSECYGLVSIKIPSSITSISNYAFSSCYKLVEIINHSSLDIKAGDTNYGNIGFYAKEVHTGESKIKNINDCLFYTYNEENYILGYIGDDSILAIPNGCDGKKYDIYKYAFYGSTNIKSLTIPDSVTNIGDCAFWGCTNLTRIAIPNNVINIGKNAFYYNDNLVSASIGKGVKNINSDAFSGCYKLVEVINNSTLQIEANDNSYGNIGFYAKEVHTGESKIDNRGDYLFYTYDDVNYLLGYIGNDKDLILPLSYIGETYELFMHAFYKNQNITSIKIIDGVTAIGDFAWFYCDKLTSVELADSIIIIGEGVFDNCSALENVTLPNKITSIKDYTFYGCKNLKNIAIPENVTSIGKVAFCNCDHLTNIVIPNSVTSVGEGAFYSCDSLTDIYYTGSEEEWAEIEISIHENDILSNVDIHYNYVVGVGHKHTYSYPCDAFCDTCGDVRKISSYLHTYIDVGNTKCSVCGYER